MSHEIRTPLNGALSMITLLERTGLTPEQREYVDAINFSSETLLTIISDVLDMSAIEAGKLQLEHAEFGLQPVLENIIALFQPKAESQNNRLSYQLDERLLATLVGDSIRLRQLLFNLVGNALKFTENGTVSVEISQSGEMDDKGMVPLLFEVKDSGIGIAEAYKAKLFDSFSQADSSINRRFGGNGLGLAICRHIVNAMGGTIGVESVTGEGSTFWIKMALPLSLQLSSQAARSEQDNSAELEMAEIGREILLVEDDPINQRAESALLKQDGHRVTIANDGYSALKILERSQVSASPPFDLVLMDIRMPGLNGYETTERIRSMPESISRIPIVALTADVTQENIEKCLTAGINKVLSKPIRRNELSEVLRTIPAGTI
jgi:CheY-like chemotaxis protein